MALKITHPSKRHPTFAAHNSRVRDLYARKASASDTTTLADGSVDQVVGEAFRFDPCAGVDGEFCVDAFMAHIDHAKVDAWVLAMGDAWVEEAYGYAPSEDDEADRLAEWEDLAGMSSDTFDANDLQWGFMIDTTLQTRTRSAFTRSIHRAPVA